MELSEDEQDAYAAERTFVLPGAEAKDPKDDEIWKL